MSDHEHPQAVGSFEDLRSEFIITQDAAAGSWFGLPAAKINGKVFMALWLNGDLIVKLPTEPRQEALQRHGAMLFQPMPERKPMPEWAQVPFDHVDQWKQYAQSGFDYVRELSQQ